MSPKNIARDTKIKSHQTNFHSRELLIVAGILFVIGLVVALVTIQSRDISVASSPSVEAVSYNNALAMDYAQPYLEANTSVMTEFSDALAMQYAQPYLEAEADAAGMTTAFSDALALEYARPYLDKQADTTVPYNDALALEYALPWLVPQSAAETTVPYRDDLAMEYAKPWLNTEPTANCNGRLDEMYACRFGN